jgi:two-component system, LytTR family, sensor kinase
MKLFSLLNRFWQIIVVAAALKWMSFHVWVVNTWFGQGLEFALWDSLVSNFLLIGLILGLTNIILNYIPSSGKFWFALGMSFLLAWLWQWLVMIGLKEVAANQEVYAQFLEKSIPIRWTIGFLVLAGTSISSVFYNMYSDRLISSQREAETQAMIREAELQKLQLQLQPHFLFNSLNSINAMIMAKPDEARQMIEQLSEFLRITTKRADQHFVKFSEEWKYLQLYLGIEKVRFGHRLQIDSSVTDDAMEFVIPTLMLQPLVENAIKFGLYGTTDGVKISLQASMLGDMLMINIENPFDSDMQPQRGSGFGLNGLKRRLYLLFARNDLLDTATTENKFAVTLKLPRAHA